MLENIPILQNFVVFLSQNAKYLIVTLLVCSLGGNVYQYLDNKKSTQELNDKLTKVVTDGITYERANKSELNNILVKIIDSQMERQKSTDQLLQEILDNQSKSSTNPKKSTDD